MFRSSLAGRTSLFASFPSTSYWATFTKSLRDESSAHTPNPYVDAHERLPDLYRRWCPRFASFHPQNNTEAAIPRREI